MVYLNSVFHLAVREITKDLSKLDCLQANTKLQGPEILERAG